MSLEDVIDKAVAELRVVQTMGQQTGKPLSWNLEFRHVGEDSWYPVRIERYYIPEPQFNEDTDEPTDS